MTQFEQSDYVDITQTAEYRAELAAQQTFMAQVFNWMAIGLLATATAALATSVFKPTLMAQLEAWHLIILLLVQIVIATGMSLMIDRLPAIVLAGMFMIYAAIIGMVFSLLFLIYTDASLYAAFFITAGMFGSVATWSYITKKDLSGWGTILFMALIGLILSLIVSMFLPSPWLTFGISTVGVILFTALTAYDVKKIKRTYTDAPEGSRKLENLAIYGAFFLYLDFVNLFIYLLSLIGSRRH